MSSRSVNEFISPGFYGDTATATKTSDEPSHIVKKKKSSTMRFVIYGLVAIIILITLTF